MTAFFGFPLLIAFPSRRLLAALVALGFLYSALQADLTSAIGEAIFVSVFGIIFIVWRRTARGFWRVERERWDRKDQGLPPQD